MISTSPFYKERIIKIFSEKKDIVDIGGSLRLLKDRGNIHTTQHNWLMPYLEKVSYRILDVVPDYNPHIVGDIHALPFDNNTIDAILCISVLEHVEDPRQAIKEMYRVLKPGGYCFVYVPFLFYYHAEKGYFPDYWRFTKDVLPVLFKDFSFMEIKSALGAIATWVNISPLGAVRPVASLASFLDLVFHKRDSNQASGYDIFLIK